MSEWFEFRVGVFFLLKYGRKGEGISSAMHMLSARVMLV